MTDTQLPVQIETISAEDKAVLDQASAQKQFATLTAEKAVLQYNNIVLQLYVKHGLTNNDALDDKGVIHRNVGEGK